MTNKIQMMSHDKEWQVVDGVETLVPVEQFDIDPVTDSSCVKIEGFRTLEETLNEKNMFTPEVNATKVMDKVGGEYHQNVVDGAYEEAILYGNTQVNLCEEDSSNALQIPTTFTSFNNGELQINNKENQVVAPLIKGVTMVNLAQINSSSVASGKGVPIQNVKGNTVYTLSFTFTTKNTNSGVVIECYDVNGEYLGNVMHKTGLGDVVKFTFTTHANTTKVHICNNAAYGGETIQLDEIMLIEGDQTALDIPFFKGMKSVELVRPLTNLFTDDITTYESGASATNSSGNVVVTSKSSSSWSAIAFKMNMLKNNTKYLVMWDNLNTTQTSTSNTGQLIGIYYVDPSVQIIGTINNNSICPTKRSLIFDTKDFDVTKLWLKIHATLNNTETGTTTVTGLRVFEYDDYLRSVDLQSIGWFSGTKNVAVEPIKTCSKNLYPYGDINFTPVNGQVWHDGKGKVGMTGDIASKSQTRFLLRKGNYIISSSSLVNCGMQVVGDKEEILTNGVQSGANATFILDKDTYCTVRFKSVEANVACTSTNIQIERGATATDYVTHDSRYYEPNGQNAIVLRSLPNGVCDTFNLQTGEYIQRIGEITVNGEGAVDNIIDGAYARIITPSNKTTNVYTNEIRFYCSGAFTLKNNGATLNNYGIYENPANFVLFDKTVSSAEEFASKYSKVVIQYQLATPITTIIPRTIKRNNNGTVSTINFGTYVNKESLVLPKNPSYLTINSMTSIKPVVEPITYVDFKTRLKANTDYSVIIDKDSANKTINLGGTSKTYADKMLVRTPSINLEQNLRISGSGSIQNITVIEGDVLDKELPYFNNMCNVKMPIVRNCGKNLFNGKFTIGGLSTKDGSYDATNKDWAVTDYIKVYNMQDITFNSSVPFSMNNFVYFKYDINKKFLGYIGIYNSYTTASISLDDNVHYIRFRVPSAIPSNSKFQLEEGIQATPYEPYRGNDICLVQGEIGLSRDMFEQGGIAYPVNGTVKTYEQCKGSSNNRIRSKDLFKINGGKKYRLSFLDSNKRIQWYLWDASGQSLGITGNWSNATTNIEQIIDTPEEAKYMSLMFRNANDTPISLTDIDMNTIQLVELDSTVQLRSLPNGVKDELNLLTGEYIQRVGEVVIDGSQSIHSEKPNHKRMYIIKDDMKKLQNYSTSMVCDKINVSMGYSQLSSAENTWVSGHTDTINQYPNRNWIYFNIENIEDVSSMTTYLQSNPITVQYELAEPIISYPRIVSNTQEREVGIKLPNGVCDTYNPSTGITVKRVGKVVLDGSEKWLRDSSSTKPTDLERFSTPIGDMVSSPYNTGNFVVETSGYNIVNNDKTSPRKLPNTWNYYQANIYLDFATTAFGMTTGDSVDAKISKLKTYLASNPITIYYELKNPIITTDIVLPNGVHDEYNPITGLYTKRVGLIEFDGSDDELWTARATDTENYKGFYVLLKNITPQPLPNSSTINNKFNIINDQIWTDLDREGSYIGGSAVGIIVAKSKLTTQDIDGLRLYLSKNPFKVWYELQTPITYQLTPYFGLPMPYAYKDGYLIMDSAYDGQTLPPEVKYKLLANRTGQITQNNVKLQNHTSKLSNLEAMLVEATLQSMYEREMMAFNLEMVNINLINLEE